jgi:hypothetical protein
LREGWPMADDDLMQLRKWRDLCQEGRDAQRLVDEHPLFDEQGRTTPERLAEYTRLVQHVRDVERRKDKFLAPYRRVP